MSKINAYLDNIPAVQAEAKMLLADPLMLPHMRAGDMKKALRRWERTIGIGDRQTPKEALASLLALGGIGVKRVPKRKQPSEPR